MEEPAEVPLESTPPVADPSQPAPPPPFDYDGPGGRRMWLMRNEQWLIYCIPFLVYMLFGVFEPVGPSQGMFGKEGADHGFFSYVYPFTYSYNIYPYVYSLKIVATCLAIVLVWPGYWQFPWKVHWISVAVGIVGAVLWVAINKGQRLIVADFLNEENLELLNQWHLGALTKLGARPGFNPLNELQDNSAWAWAFLAIRFFGLVIVVPIIEEFFLRGFLMRYFINIDWWTVPFATMTPLAILVGIGVPMLMHPQELVAAFVWFSMVTWLMFYTKSIWDCIVAHGVTNLLMGLWVVFSGDWWLM